MTAEPTQSSVTADPTSASQTLRWGILGAGRIAGTFARGLAVSTTG